MDKNHNGITDPGELYTLPQLGVKRISVHFRTSQYTDRYGNIFRYEAAINDDSMDHRTYDVSLGYIIDRDSILLTPVRRRALKSARPSGYK